MGLKGQCQAGLFSQRAVDIRYSTYFTPPFQARFVDANSTSEPFDFLTENSPEFSGAYQGNTGEDLFIAMDSNHTQKTLLPSWVDSTAMYLPFREAEPS